MPQNLPVGEVGEARRRLDLQAAAIADVDRLDDEARRQRGDDRRNAQRPDQQVVGGADRHAAGERRQRARRAIIASLPSITFMATALARPILAGSDRSTLPGPERDDEHLADADDDREDGERQRRRDHAAGAVAAGEGDRREPDQQRADERPDPGLGEQRLQRAPSLSLSLRLISARAASTMMRMAPLAPTCQSGGMCMKVSSGEAASASVSAPMHRADRRDAAADELAAAEDDAGDRQQRVAIADIGVGRGGDADQRHAGEHAEQRRPARTATTLVLSSDQPARPIAAGLPPAPRRIAP